MAIPEVSAPVEPGRSKGARPVDPACQHMSRELVEVLGHPPPLARAFPGAHLVDPVCQHISRELVDLLGHRPRLTRAEVVRQTC